MSVSINSFVQLATKYDICPEADGIWTYLDQINFGKGLVRSRLLDIEDRDDVLVVKVSKELHFS
jgi:hypothetical protein